MIPCEHKLFPDWKLERYRLGELPEGEMATIRKALENDMALRARLEALTTSDKDILAMYPTGWVARQIGDRMAEHKAMGSARSWIGPTLAAAAIILLGVAVYLFGSRVEPMAHWSEKGLDGVEITRLKGGEPRLILFRKTDRGEEPLHNNHWVSDGDLIQIFYFVPDSVYGVILSVDGHGTVTQHLPESGSDAALLQPGEPVALGFSYQLDDAPKWERFYLITSKRRFLSDAVVRLVRATGGVDSLYQYGSFDHFSFTLQKENKP